ncbi:MAG TPA: hypothetical protein VKM93_02745 [Terriglobia bacterium]|nr:hypothetical protein [Terriglobia bacterium]
MVVAECLDNRIWFGTPRDRDQFRRGLPRFGGPFVGFVGTENSASISHTDSKLVCRLSPKAFWVIVLMSILFGPGLSLLLWLQPEGMNRHLPPFIKDVVWCFSLLAWFSLFRYVLREPRFEVPYESGNILFFRGPRAKPFRVIRREEIQQFEISERIFLEEGHRIVNYVLSVKVLGGRAIDLCGSTDHGLVSSLKQECQRITGRTT